MDRCGRGISNNHETRENSECIIYTSGIVKENILTKMQRQSVTVKT